MIVIVTGGRDFSNKALVHSILSYVYGRWEIKTLKHGGCGSGADWYAEEWHSLYGNGVERIIFAADWNRHGRSAGPIRNKEMVDSGGDVLLAFKGNNGTNNTIINAKANKMHVVCTWQLSGLLFQPQLDVIDDILRERYDSL